jgi:hypothetical protein
LAIRDFKTLDFIQYQVSSIQYLALASSSSDEGRMTATLRLPLCDPQKNRHKQKIAYHCAMRRSLLHGFVFVLSGIAVKGLGAESSSSVNPNEGWKLTSGSKDVALYSRARAGSPLKEFRAIGAIDAPTSAVHAVLDDFENYPNFMPYTLECRLLKRESDSIITYQRLSPKICEDRDYTLRVWKKSWPGAEGFTYLDQWKPANDLGPAEKRGIVRVKICDGAWLLEPDGAIKTRATYSVYTDTGGMIPAFIANRASRVGITKLFDAVRKQVKNPKYAQRDAL